MKEHYGNRIPAEWLKDLDWSLNKARHSAAWYNRNAVVIETWIQTVPPHFNINI
jgi:hypothetical protein